MRLHQTEKLLDREGNNQQNEKGNSKNGLKYLQIIIIIIRSRYSKYIRKSYNSIAKKQIKMGKGPELTFLKRSHTNGQQEYENVLNVTNHQENANQNHNEVSSHSCQRMVIIKKTKDKCCCGCGENRTLVQLLVGM